MTITIYSLMKKVRSLYTFTVLAAKYYREGKMYYKVFEEQARASLDTLLDVDYISTTEYAELRSQLNRVFRLYKTYKRY